MGRRSRAAAAEKPRPRSTPALPPPSPATPSRVLAVLAGLVALAYGNAIALGLAVDGPYLLSNPRLAALTAEHVWQILTRPYWWPTHADDLYRPVTTLSFLLAPGSAAVPWPIHLANVLLHALNVWLALRIGLRVLGAMMPAAVAAAFFAVHPVGVDTVTNVAGRADLLAAAAVLGGLLAHIRAIERPGEARRWHVVLGLAALGGVFAKENAVVLLPVLVLYDVAFAGAASLRDALVAAWRRGRASYAVVGTALVVMALVRGAVMADETPHWPPFGDNPLAAAPLWARGLTALGVLGWSAMLWLWPAHLSADYSYDQIPVLGPESPLAAHAAWVATAIVLGAGAVITWRVRRSQPALFFCFFFALGTRLPTANLLLPIGSIMAERFLYLSSVGVFGALAAAAQVAMAQLSEGEAPRRDALKKAAAIVGVLAIVALIARTLVRNRDWRDDEAIWQSAIEVVPHSNKPYKGLARVRYEQGRLDEAIALLERGLAVFDRRPLDPADYSSDLLFTLGRYYAEQATRLRRAGDEGAAAGADAKALATLERAAATDRATNERVKAHLAARGTPAAEIRDIGVAGIHQALGETALRLGRLERAREAFAWHRRLDPTHAAAYLALGRAAAADGRGDEERTRLLQALILEPDRAEVWAHLEPALARAGIAGIAREGGRPRIDPASPEVAALVARACPDLAGGLREARREAAASEVEGICTQRLGWRKEVVR